MAKKSFTKRKLEITDLESVIAKAKELLREEAGTFICTKINDRLYKIGDYKVLHKSTQWVAIRENTDAKLVFNERINAVAYCALMHVGRDKAAKEIMSLDNRIQQLQVDEQLFRIRLSNAINKKDDWKVDLYNARYGNAKVHLMTTKTELQKTLNLAKYLKLWAEPDQ